MYYSSFFINHILFTSLFRWHSTPSQRKFRFLASDLHHGRPQAITRDLGEARVVSIRQKVGVNARLDGSLTVLGDDGIDRHIHLNKACEQIPSKQFTSLFTNLLFGPSQCLRAVGSNATGVWHGPSELLRVSAGGGIEVGLGHLRVGERGGHGPLGAAVLVLLLEGELQRVSHI